MSEVTKFEDKVREALQAAMRHAVAGHQAPVGPGKVAGYHTFCNDPAHALHILSDAGIRPINEAIAQKVLDK